MKRIPLQKNNKNKSGSKILKNIIGIHDNYSDDDKSSISNSSNSDMFTLNEVILA